MTGDLRAEKKRGCGENGAVLVESAITIVLLFVMLFGVIDFGRALYTYHFVANAAREASRWASVNGYSCTSDPACPNGGPASAANVQMYVENTAPPGIGTANSVQMCPPPSTSAGVLGVCASWPGNGTLACPSGSNSPGCPVQVTVSYNFGFLVPLIHRGVLPMSSSSETTISH